MNVNIIYGKKLGKTYNLETVGHRCICEAGCEGGFEIVACAGGWDVNDFVLLLDLEVKDRLEHVVNYVNVELEVLLGELVVEAKVSPKEPETGVSLLVLHDRADELLELFVSYILESVAILEVLVCPLDQVDICRQILSFVVLLQDGRL